MSWGRGDNDCINTTAKYCFGKLDMKNGGIRLLRHVKPRIARPAQVQWRISKVEWSSKSKEMTAKEWFSDYRECQSGEICRSREGVFCLGDIGMKHARKRLPLIQADPVPYKHDALPSELLQELSPTKPASKPWTLIQTKQIMFPD